MLTLLRVLGSSWMTNLACVLEGQSNLAAIPSSPFPFLYHLPMPRTVRTPLLSLFAAAAATAVLGYPIVRFLPLYASIPLMVILTLVATFEALFFAASANRAAEVTPATDRLFYCIFFLCLLAPTAITLYLFLGPLV